MGGIGRTFLARALAPDPLLRPAFRHGVLWASFADAPPDHWLQEWARPLQLPTVKDEPLPSLRQRIAQTLREPKHRFLLALDDAWETEPVETLPLENPASAVLITARDRSLVQKLRTDDFIVEVGGMEESEAEELIRRRMGAAWHEANRPHAAELIRRTDHSPSPWKSAPPSPKNTAGPPPLTASARTKRPSPPSPSAAPSAGSTASASSWMSVSHLTPEEQDLFERLGLRAPGAPFALRNVLYAWPFPSLLAGKLADDPARIPVLVTLRCYERDEEILPFLRRIWALSLLDDLEAATKAGETEGLSPR